MPDNDYAFICDGNCNRAILRYYFHPTLPGYIDLLPDDFGFYSVVNNLGEEVETWIVSMEDALRVWSRLKRLTQCPIGVRQWASKE